MDGPPELEPPVAEQRGYHRAIAADYEDYAIPGAWGDEVSTALESFGPAGSVLEQACGPGTWTRQLLSHAASMLALDASPEMLAIASARVRDERNRFIQADIIVFTISGAISCST